MPWPTCLGNINKVNWALFLLGQTLRGPPSLVFPVDSSWHGVDTQGRWRRVEVGVENHMLLETSTSTSHCKRCLACKNKGRSRKGYGFRDMCCVCLLALSDALGRHGRKPPGHGSYFSAGGFQKMLMPPTSSSSTSHRGPEEVRGKHGVLDCSHCQSFSLQSSLAVRAPKARICGSGLGGIRVRTCQRRGPKTGPPDKTSSKTSSLVSVAGFPETVPVTVPGWFLFLLSPVPVTTFRNGFCYSRTGFLLRMYSFFVGHMPSPEPELGDPELLRVSRCGLGKLQISILASGNDTSDFADVEAVKAASELEMLQPGAHGEFRFCSEPCPTGFLFNSLLATCFSKNLGSSTVSLVVLPPPNAHTATRGMSRMSPISQGTMVFRKNHSKQMQMPGMSCTTKFKRFQLQFSKFCRFSVPTCVSLPNPELQTIKPAAIRTEATRSRQSGHLAQV